MHTPLSLLISWWGEGLGLPLGLLESPCWGATSEAWLRAPQQAPPMSRVGTWENRQPRNWTDH